MTSPQRILFLSGELPDLEIRRTLEKRGCRIKWMNDLSSAWQALGERDFSLVIVDLDTVDRLPAESGSVTEALSLIKRLREAEILKSTPVLVLGEWGTGRPAFALANGADAYERTPVEAKRLAASIERLLAEPRLVGLAAGASE